MIKKNTRCYECSGDELFDIESYKAPDIIERIYDGKGMFRCPRCNHILDLSQNTYNTIISIDVNGDVSVIRADEKLDNEGLDKEGRDIFVTDLTDAFTFKSEDAGVYRCEVYWKYYQCDGYESDECDVTIEIFKKEKVEIQ